ncbi:hypothetical protein AB6A40_005584 [Gnathostoma spinigerum]|uniref:MFS transporter n=1 Tax=Gnathostoma spinigerum TaxID=75299 RepID=A0ABD6EFV0_9BILA
MNSSVWAVWIAAIGNMFSIHMVVVFAPIYLHQVLHYDILNVGIAAAMPTLVQFAVKMIAGCYSDKITTLSETQKVRIFNSIAFVGMALCLIALSFTSFYMLRYFSLFLLISSAAILGFNTGGFFKSSTLVARQFSHLVNAVVQVIMCLAMLTVPPIVFALTPEGTSSEWMVVFLIHAVLLLLCNSVFCFFGQGEAALFTSNQRLLNTIGVSSAAARAV